MAGKSWYGLVGHGQERTGVVLNGRQGKARTGAARHDAAGQGHLRQVRLVAVNPRGPRKVSW